ncbi:MAG: FkbM family methyltransferase, partial [Gemmatimonadetes bacterium]|nr:FkbM family methyltransferase [Gemmatimonadota bacterium]NIQ58226.1 FkbM family methyltransferase [Gemmatimonadota bacterium]NIU78436.1 FkbM family methyltransferase [Gammaproteobacteria bacterium]NIX47351.1 FkbM family methyltransferase [Gemmatimonadota bacterium]NIY11721.1 FkbM family methyltransferase [Gemmatimonadota bacterium]
RAMVRPGQTVLDVGARAGYYTLLASERVGVTGHVVAFEPDPRNFAFLERHVRVNRCLNVTLERAAATTDNGKASFARGTGTGTGHLDEDGDLTVATLELDAYIRQQGLRPDIVKVDVEGAEADVLAGARELLRTVRPTLFLSTHGRELNRMCRLFLNGLGYDVLGIDDDSVAAAAELLCVDALSIPPVPA